MAPITLKLPWPPSVNTYWRKWRGRICLSDEAKAFKTAAAIALAELCGQPPRWTGRVAIRIELHPPDRRKRDIDNFGGKAVLDALTSAGLWLDDQQVDDLHIIRGDCTPGGEAIIEAMEITA